MRAEPMDRVLDLLHKVKDEQDGTLTFRRSCGHGVCGSDAMLINGRNRLACKIRVDQLGGKRITVAPLPGLPLIKDLVVDMEGFFAKFRSVQPYLQDDGTVPTRERRQSQAERERFDDTTKCILCAACTSSCPSFWAQPSYVGPAAIVNAHRFIFDSRDDGAEERLEILADKDGVWRCRTIFNCTDACPQGIHITRRSSRCRRRSWSDAPERAVAPGLPAPRDPHGRCGPRQPGARVARRGADRRLPRRRPGSDRGPGRDDLGGPGRPDQQRRRVDRRAPGARARPAARAPRRSTCSSTRS